MFVGLVSVGIFFPVGELLLAVAQKTRSSGVIGAIVFGLLYVAATIAFLPASLLTIIAGFSYGIDGAIAVVWPASVIGATIAFTLGRYIARDWVSKQVAKRPNLAAINVALAGRAFWVIFLLRLSPLVPFNVLNYFLGITRSTVGAYVLATSIGMLPGIFLYTYVGSVVTDAAAVLSGNRPDAGPWGTLLFVLGLIATFAVTFYISRAAKRSLSREW